MSKRNPWVKALEHARNYGWDGNVKWINCQHRDLNIIPFDEEDKTSAMARCARCDRIVAILNDGPGETRIKDATS